MSCSAVSCKNRPSPGTGISFHRFPLDDKDRLQKWLVNLRRDNFTPSPSARICSEHFEDGCFFMNIHGKLCLSKTAVPTLFYYPISFRSWRKYLSKHKEEKVDDDSRGPLNVVGTTTDHHPPGPITTNQEAPHDLFKTETRGRFVEVDVILNESIKEDDDDDIALDVPNVSPVILKESIKEEDDDDSRGHVVGTTTDHHPPGPITTNQEAPHDLFETETRSRFVEVDVILNESIKEDDDDDIALDVPNVSPVILKESIKQEDDDVIALDVPNVSPVILTESIKEEEDDVALDMPEANESPVIPPTEVCVITVQHDHCYCLGYSNADGQHVEILKNKLQTVLGKVTAFRKQMKLKNQMIRRLKRRVLLLKAEVKSEQSEKEKMHVTLSKLQKDLDCQLQPTLTSPDL